MSFDPTTNRIPFGLLTLEEQATLKAWPHGMEVHARGELWVTIHDKWWDIDTIYRGLPAPKVTCYWFNIYDGDTAGLLWEDQKVAASSGRNNNSIALMRMDICNGEVTVTKEYVSDKAKLYGNA